MGKRKGEREKAIIIYVDTGTSGTGLVLAWYPYLLYEYRY